MAWKDTAKDYYNSGRSYTSRKSYEASGRGYGSSGKFGYGVTGNVARAGSNTVQAVTGSWSHASWRLKGLLAFVLTFAVLFVPFGIFQYAGWSMYLSFCWVINSFYWFLATIVNAILNLFINIVDILFGWITEYIGGTYQSLDSWQLSTGSLLDPDVYKPTTFNTDYLLSWLWDNFGDTVKELWDSLKSMGDKKA